MEPLRVRRLRELDLVAPAEPDRPAYLSAASGLVCSGGELYVVADDELHLGRFAGTGTAPGTLLQLFDGDLPDKPRKRKKHKPDLEVLLQLPPSPARRHGALLALGSGSKAQRRRGALLALDAHGRVCSGVTQVDATPLYERLEARFDDLNIEGGWVHGNSLCLLQRGNKGESPNAILEFDCGRIMAALEDEQSLPGISPRGVTEMDLGSVDGVPLCFTDGCVLADGSWVFSAVAEDTDDSRVDGAFVGAAIGMATPDSELVWRRRVYPDYKIEGIEARLRDGRLALLCVTDADDPDTPALLLAAG